MIMARKKSATKNVVNPPSTLNDINDKSTVKRKYVRKMKPKTATKGAKGRPRSKNKLKSDEKSVAATTSATQSKRGRKPGKKLPVTAQSKSTKNSNVRKKRASTTVRRTKNNTSGVGRRRHYHSLLTPVTNGMKLKPSKEFLQEKLIAFKNQLQIIRAAQKNPQLGRQLILSLEKHCDKVVDRVRIKRKSKHKMSKIAKIRDLENHRIDLNTPQSLLCDFNWTQILTRQNFDRLPAYYQYHLTKLLPKCDQLVLDNNVICPSETAFTNEYFTSAVNNYFNRLVEGKLTTESLAKMKREMEKARNRLDPLKLKYFEPVFRVPDEDLPKTPTEDEKYEQGMAFMNAYVHCVDKVQQIQRKQQVPESKGATTATDNSQKVLSQQQPINKKFWSYLPLRSAMSQTKNDLQLEADFSKTIINKQDDPKILFKSIKRTLSRNEKHQEIGNMKPATTLNSDIKQRKKESQQVNLIELDDSYTVDDTVSSDERLNDVEQSEMIEVEQVNDSEVPIEITEETNENVPIIRDELKPRIMNATPIKGESAQTKASMDVKSSMVKVQPIQVIFDSNSSALPKIIMTALPRTSNQTKLELSKIKRNKLDENVNNCISMVPTSNMMTYSSSTDSSRIPSSSPSNYNKRPKLDENPNHSNISSAFNNNVYKYSYVDPPSSSPSKINCDQRSTYSRNYGQKMNDEISNVQQMPRLSTSDHHRNSPMTTWYINNNGNTYQNADLNNSQISANPLCSSSSSPSASTKINNDKSNNFSNFDSSKMNMGKSDNLSNDKMTKSKSQQMSANLMHKPHKQEFIVNMAMNEITFVGQHQPIDNVAMENSSKKAITDKIPKRRGRRPKNPSLSYNKTDEKSEEKVPSTAAAAATTNLMPIMTPFVVVENKIIPNENLSLKLASTASASVSTANDETKGKLMLMPVMNQMQFLWQSSCFRNFTRCIRLSSKSIENLAIIFRHWIEYDPQLLSSQLFETIIMKNINCVRSALINTIMSIKALIAMTSSLTSMNHQLQQTHLEAKQSFDVHLMQKLKAFKYDEIINNQSNNNEKLLKRFNFIGQQANEVFDTTYFLLMSEKEQIQNLNTILYMSMSLKFINYLNFFVKIMRYRFDSNKQPKPNRLPICEYNQSLMENNSIATNISND